MIPAYSELYLDDAMDGLGEAFDFAIRQKHVNPEVFQERFASSVVADTLSKGSMRYVSGISAQECAGLIMGETYTVDDYIDYGAEFWSGWILAYVQWYSGFSFVEILDKNPLMFILGMYKAMHEANPTKARDAMLDRMNMDNPLASKRRCAGLTQEGLAKLSGVSLRNIRAYEQDASRIGRAESETIGKLARTLRCTSEDLLRYTKD